MSRSRRILINLGANEKGRKTMEHYCCLLCGEKTMTGGRMTQSPRHIRAGANLSLRIIYQFGNCPWCEPQGKKNIPVSWPACTNPDHKAMLAKCEKLQGPLEEVSAH
jgi:hypothetical protein